jgi:hypothetical protein
MIIRLEYVKMQNHLELSPVSLSKMVTDLSGFVNQGNPFHLCASILGSEESSEAHKLTESKPVSDMTLRLQIEPGLGGVPWY